MDYKRSSKGFWFVGTCLAIGAISLAHAQSKSPFANKKKKQAWETAAPGSTPAPSSSVNGSYTAPAPSYQNLRSTIGNGDYTTPSSAGPSYQVPAYQAPNHKPSTASTPSSIPAQNAGAAFPSQTVTPSYIEPAAQSAGSYTPPVYNTAPVNAVGQGAAQRPAQGYTGQAYQPYQNLPYQTQNYADQNPARIDYPGRASRNYAQPFQNSVTIEPQYRNPLQSARGGYAAQGQPQARGQYQLPTPQGPRRSWLQRLGFGNLATSLTGYLKLGAAVTENDTLNEDGVSADFIADGSVRGEVSAITQGGLEYGLGARVRAQYDADRRGFGGRVGDCPPELADCPSVVVSGLATALRGHTSQFYTSGPSNAKDIEVALEGAYVFLRSAYGDITIGRDDGSAYLFSLGAPSLVAVGASNSPVDYTGLDSVKTVNDASGFSEKIAYTSPRLLGDQIGVGVQFGVSYAPDARACGVDYCVRRDDVSGALSPDLEDVVAAGLALDRTFNNGLSVEGTVTYATASEQSGLAGFDDLQSLGLGLELGYGNWKLGGSYLDSNNGLQDGDYTAYDIGLTWQPSAWGVTAGYGHARDENVDLTSDQGLLAVSYDFGNYRLATGVQYIERRVPVNGIGADAGVISRQKERSGALFVEGSVKF